MLSLQMNILQRTLARQTARLSPPALALRAPRVALQPGRFSSTLIDTEPRVVLEERIVYPPLRNPWHYNESFAKWLAIWLAAMAVVSIGEGTIKLTAYLLGISLDWRETAKTSAELGKLRTDLVTYNNRILQLESAMRTPVPAPSPAPASSLARSLKLV